jgi:RimJ/RimL family protein N-acetyltransferase
MLGTILSGERVRLRAPALDDLPTFIRWFAEPEVTRYLLRRYPPSPAQERHPGGSSPPRPRCW